MSGSHSVFPLWPQQEQPSFVVGSTASVSGVFRCRRSCGCGMLFEVEAGSAAAAEAAVGDWLRTHGGRCAPQRTWTVAESSGGGG